MEYGIQAIRELKGNREYVLVPARGGSGWWVEKFDKGLVTIKKNRSARRKRDLTVRQFNALIMRWDCCLVKIS